MATYIYFIQVEGGGPIKIGITQNDPRHRMVKIQSDCPWPVELLGAIKGDLAQEAALHCELETWNIQGEWFEAVPEVLAVVERSLKSPDAVGFPKKKKAPKHVHPLCQYRSERDLTLKDIAVLVGVAHASLSRIESGQAKPSIDLAAKLAKATGIHIGEFRPDIYRIFYPEPGASQ